MTMIEIGVQVPRSALVPSGFDFALGSPDFLRNSAVKKRACCNLLQGLSFLNQEFADHLLTDQLINLTY